MNFVPLPAYRIDPDPYANSASAFSNALGQAVAAYRQRQKEDQERMGLEESFGRIPELSAQAQSLAKNPELARNVLAQYLNPTLPFQRNADARAGAMHPYQIQNLQAQIGSTNMGTALHRQQLETARQTAPYDITIKRVQAQSAERDFNTPKPNTFDLGPDHTRFDQRRNPDGTVTAVPIATGGQAGGKVPPGFRPTRDGNLEAIPGGPADIKTNEKRQQDFNSMQYMFQKLDDLGTQANIVRDHPGLEGITGVRGMIPNFPGSKAANAEAERTTLLSKSAFAALQDMRNASKTGGALGAIAVQELVMLQNATVALEKSQDAKQMRTNLDRLQKQIETSKARIAAAYNDHWNNGGAATRQPVSPTAASPNQSTPQAPQAPQGPVRVTTPEEASKLPSGTIFQSPDGRMWQVP